jgi:nicotinamide phosphoribosyltransferase
MSNYPATLLCDFYKISHREQYPEKTELVYSTWTPRMSRIEGVDKVVSYGFQYFVKEYLIDYFQKQFFDRPKKDIVDGYYRIVKYTLGVESPDTSHIEALHDLGYLPIKLRALKEGTLVPLRTPMMTIENTIPEFFWLTNYLETLLSNEIWQPMTAATIAREYYNIGAKYADKTVGNRGHLPFQFHDFSLRGMEGHIAGTNSASAHLLSFVGTDTISAILYHEKYYGADVEKELVGTSIPATEHSVMCANATDEQDEYESYRRLLEDIYPSGIFSVVSDTYDFWKVIGETIPSLKETILNRDGKMVVRPDSGDPVKIICGDHSVDNYHAKIGVVESLWETFGGTVNELGYRELDPHVGAIYGDSITLDRAKEIFKQLEEKGFASSNIVLGVGSYTYQYNTRDTFGFAVKATYTVISGQQKLIFKDPKTDDGTKKSQRGRVVVLSDAVGDLSYQDGLNQQQWEDLQSQDEMQDVFVNGKLVREQTLSEIRETLANQ